MDFTKIINPVQGSDYKAHPFNVFVEVQYKEGRLSLVGVEGPMLNGNCKGGCGQIQDNFMLPNGKIQEGYSLRPLWNEAMLMGLRMIWDAYHLNDLKAGCQHQEDAGYTYDKNKGHLCPICNYNIGHGWNTQEVPQEVIDWLVSLPDTEVTPYWV